MKLQRLSMLFLSGCISLTGFGCAAFQATLERPLPATASRGTSADRLVSIARIYENQGQHERAEATYRRALRSNPSDPVVRSRIEQLVARRQERQFSADPAAAAIAAADAVNGAQQRQSPLAPQNALVTASAVQPAPTADASTPAPATKLSRSSESVTADTGKVNFSEKDLDWADIAPLPPEPSARALTLNSEATDVRQPSEVVNGDKPAAAPVAAAPSAGSTSTRAEVTGEVTVPARVAVATAETVPALVETPRDHVDLLIRTLTQSASSEERVVAAVLLGDCAKDDSRIDAALAKCCDTAMDPALLMAVCDSQIQRGRQTDRTLECLVSVASRTKDVELRVQAVSALRHFATTENSAVCAEHLLQLLGSPERKVRTAAVLTLGDFETHNAEALAELTLLAANDSHSVVRQAALSAVERMGSRTSESAEVIGIGHSVESESDRAGESIEIVPARL